MKLLVRSLVVALAISGAVATSYANASSAKASVHISKTSAAPIPVCPPNDANACGM